MEFFEGPGEIPNPPISSVGVLLVNLGTPDAPTAAALRPYLKQFLWDRRVIETPRLLWWMILNGPVLTFRPKKSAALYQKIWTEEGSPLLVISRKQEDKLRRRLEELLETPIALELGMRYGSPSIPEAMRRLKAKGVEKILLLPLYPQHSATSSGTAFDEVAQTLLRWRRVPELRTVMQFHDDPGYIRSLAASIQEVWDQEGRHERLLLSFHGIPKSYSDKGDPYYEHCQQTAALLREALSLKTDEIAVSFQSQFGKEEWLGPKTDETLIRWGKEGLFSVDVVCPGFVTDCLETLEEIDEENRHAFLEAGGKAFRYIPALNDRSDFIDALAQLAIRNLSGWVEVRAVNYRQDRASASA